MSTFGDFFDAENIVYHREIPFSEIKVINEEKYRRVREKYFAPESAVIFLVPYDSGTVPENLSRYASPRDYHLYIRELSLRFEKYISEKMPGIRFFAAADDSPFDERRAAMSAGVGSLGKNGLLINEEYGSWCFIGGIYLSHGVSPEKTFPLSFCENCGECLKACPTGAINDPSRTNCLSLITQKKRTSPIEDALIDSAKCKWGCDICQAVCPMNIAAKKTPISFFLTDTVAVLNEERILSSDFEKRAYSWRGKEVPLRNIGKGKK